MSLIVDMEKKLGNFSLSSKFETDDDILALLGPSGCGKSVTLKCIAGIMKPDRGVIILNGRTLFDSSRKINLPPQKRRVGYLFQQYALFPNMDVYKNISLAVRNRSKAATDEIVRKQVSLMRLDGLERRRPSELSGGQQQRVALARIMANKPELILLDEPFSALDSELKFHMEKEVSEVIRNFGKSVILVSHDRGEAYRLCDRIAMMENGVLDSVHEKDEWLALSNSTVVKTDKIPQNVIIIPEE